MANWSALAGNTLSAVTAFPRHNPRMPSSRNTLRHTLPTLRADPDDGRPGMHAAALNAREGDCAMVLARSSGATAVLAATPAIRRRKASRRFARDADRVRGRRARRRRANSTWRYPRRCAPRVTTPPTDGNPPARRFRRLSPRGERHHRARVVAGGVRGADGARGGEGVVRGETPRGGVDGAIVAGVATDGGPRGADGRVASTNRSRERRVIDDDFVQGARAGAECGRHLGDEIVAAGETGRDARGGERGAVEDAGSWENRGRGEGRGRVGGEGIS